MSDKRARNKRPNKLQPATSKNFLDAYKQIAGLNAAISKLVAQAAAKDSAHAAEIRKLQQTIVQLAPMVATSNMPSHAKKKEEIVGIPFCSSETFYRRLNELHDNASAIADGNTTRLQQLALGLARR